MMTGIEKRVHLSLSSIGVIRAKNIHFVSLFGSYDDLGRKTFVLCGVRDKIKK
jgi:hypothetical protein